MDKNGIKQRSRQQHKEFQVLQFLYDVHYGLFNRDDIPASTRIIAQDLNIDKKIVMNILEVLSNKNEIELITHDNEYSFARITPKGLRRVKPLAS